MTNPFTSKPLSFLRDQNLSAGGIALWSPPVPFQTHAPGTDILDTQLITESMSEGVYCLNLDGFVTFANPASQLLTGWSPEDLQGRTQHSMLHHSHVDGRKYSREDCPIHESLRDGIVHRVDDEVFWRKDGTCFPVCYTSTPFFRDGIPAGAVVVFTDITQAVLRSRWKAALHLLLLDLIAGVPMADSWPAVAAAFAALQRGYTILLQAGTLDAIGPDSIRDVPVAQLDLVTDGATTARVLLRGPAEPHRLHKTFACLAAERETLQAAVRLSGQQLTAFL